MERNILYILDERPPLLEQKTCTNWEEKPTQLGKIITLQMRGTIVSNLYEKLHQ